MRRVIHLWLGSNAFLQYLLYCFKKATLIVSYFIKAVNIGSGYDDNKYLLEESLFNIPITSFINAVMEYKTLSYS